jgi:hypothetical protein
MRFGLQKLAFLAVLLGLFSIGLSQNTQVRFGQNRVQFKDFNWLYYDSDNFTTYFYPGGQEIGKFVIMAAEQSLEDLEAETDFRIGGRINIMVYNTINDLAQTNIGLGNETYNTGGTTRIFGNKLFVYFDGNHDNLMRELRKGIAIVYIHTMLSGNVFQEIINNTAFFNMPDWFDKGLAAYLGENWSTERDVQLRDYILLHKKGDFSTLEKEHPELAGQSMWYFIESVYGKSAIRNTLYLSRINRNVNVGLGYAIGSGIAATEQAWASFYAERYARDIADRKALPDESAVKIKTRKNRTFGQVKISPDGQQIAYAVFDGGAFKVMVQNLENNKSKRILKGGFRSDSYPHDQTYPLLAWTPSGTSLSAIFEKRNKIYIHTWDAASGEKIRDEVRGFQRVNSFSYTIDNQNIAMAVQIRGQSDIYTLNLVSRISRSVTDDIWDDATPAFVRSGRFEGLVFASNRPTDTLRRDQLDMILPLGKYDLFYQSLNSPTGVLGRLTNNPSSNQWYPAYYDEEYFTFLSDENGMNNQYLARLDSVYLGQDSVFLSYEEMIKDDFGNPLPGEEDQKKLVDVFAVSAAIKAVTDLPVSLMEYSVAHKSRQTATLQVVKGRRILSVNPLAIEAAKDKLRHTAYMQDVIRRGGAVVTRKEPMKIESTSIPEQPSSTKLLDSLLIGDFPYLFKSEFSNTVLPAEPDVTIEEQNRLGLAASQSILQKVRSDFRPSRIVPYRVQFSSDYVVTQLDNSILVQPYQSFSANAGVFNYPELSGMITLGISDLMEDHKIIGGFRIPVYFDGTQVFVSYENLKKRLDFKMLFYRNTYQEDLVYNISGTNFLLPIVGKIKSHYAESSISYPFDVIQSMRLIGSFQNHKRYIATTDPISATLPDDKENWTTARLEYVYDNSKEIQLNILNGLRFKFFGEYMRNLNIKKSNLYNVGFDIRHYQKVYRNIIWANRFAAASSFGQKKIAYFLGGVDTWLNPSYDFDSPVDMNHGYALQAAATNLRGLPQNIRNGNSYFLWNSELRIPVFSVFSKKPLRSSFLQNFQAVGFFDLGSAYKGLTPFDEQNPFTNEQIVYQSGGVPVTIINVDYFRRPTVLGYGAGIRTSLLGYFIRADMAWGYDGTVATSKPAWLFSLSKDF